MSTDIICALIAAAATILAAFLGMCVPLWRYLSEKKKEKKQKLNAKKLLIQFDFDCCYKNFMNYYPYDLFPYKGDRGKYDLIIEFRDTGFLEILSDFTSSYEDALLEIYGFDAYKRIRAACTRISGCMLAILELDIEGLNSLEYRKIHYANVYNKLGCGLHWVFENPTLDLAIEKIKEELEVINNYLKK